MRVLTVSADDANRRLDRWLADKLPLVGSSELQRYLRKKRVKLSGGKAVSGDYKTVSGDSFDVYINDELFAKPNDDNAYLALDKPRVNIVYEDENILLAAKESGQLSHPGGGEYVHTLLTNIQALLYQRGEWIPADENSFRPALCNRIDRNTGGIVIAAKTGSALRELTERIRLREIDKYYLAAVKLGKGKTLPANGRFENYIWKDAKLNRVYIKEKPGQGAKLAVTEYKVLKRNSQYALAECKLLTGRTHQIRAQFAAAGFPLAGDGKYGGAKESRQALYSYKLTFAFSSAAGTLDYLNGKTFALEPDTVDFVRELF
ncbi:MAG: RluA family pseudouridine synthase [Oscillospiraceae bacterium]|jgi:23S rRNA pseudouridine955/2504/2580 synthase|nr:RluA family pseudouridine synthase [Oscillospiraceae bacterium]